MKYIKAAAVLLIVIGTGKFIGQHWHWAWIPGLAIPALSLIWVFYKLGKKQILIQLNRRIDHLHIITETDDGRVALPTDLEKLVIHCKKSELYKTAAYWAELLEKAQNKHGAEVVLHIFQDGVHINEDKQGYRERLMEEIRESRVHQHGKIKEEDKAYYLKAQHGVEPPKKPFTGRMNGTTASWGGWLPGE